MSGGGGGGGGGGSVASTLAQVAATTLGWGVLAYVLGVRARSRPPLKPGVSEAVIRLLHRGRRKLLTSIIDVGGFFGMDIGGSLTKLIFFLPDAELIAHLLQRAPAAAVEAGHWRDKLATIGDVAEFVLSRKTYGGTGVRDEHLSFHISELGGSFHFVRFETRRMPGAVAMARAHGLSAGMTKICTTGGGAHRFAEMAKSTIGVTLEPRDEIDCLVKGLAFLMGYVDCEAYTFHGKNYVDRPMTGVSYPYMLVNIGSGVGFILVHSETRWERVSGTSLGGGTFYGLCHLLTGETSFDAMLDLAETGANANVDLTVGDIYGGDYTKFGLKSSTIASSFGKAITWNFGARAATPAAWDKPGAARARTTDDLASSSSTASGGAGGGAAAAAAAASAAGGRAARAETLPLPPRQPLAPSSPEAEYEASARAALQSIARDAGSFGSDVIGGRAPPRSIASQLPPTASTLAAAAAAAAASPASSPTALRIASPAAARASRTAAGAATPLLPRLDTPPQSHASPAAPAAASATPAPAPAAAAPMPTERGVTAEAADAAAAAASGGGAGSSGGGGTHGRYANEDMARSLLIMVSNNIGQLAYLNAVRYNCPHVYFAGNFLRHENTIAMRTLAYAITFWSQGNMEALFLRHEGYCGALGAFLSTLEGADGDAAE